MEEKIQAEVRTLAMPGRASTRNLVDIGGTSAYFAPQFIYLCS